MDNAEATNERHARLQQAPPPAPWHRVRACALILRDGAVLLAEFEDEFGLHYNLPAGGVEPGETVREAVCREAWEEAGVRVEVGPLAMVLDNEPVRSGIGRVAELSLVFACTAEEDGQPTPASPDPQQTGARWVPLAQLDDIVLYPNIGSEIRAYARTGRCLEHVLEHHLLPSY
ncbi:NUDIX domain-containing protein [Cohnella sp. REN36]|uniref:NUDIX domain-containing protein n=1 Tax=Cohnella sp. REN36 TaxID=2887347 RepID=UPI001D14E0AF|nr:NUDIX domain-containing protein [Cohnella sp. REN36]MCC3375008.1 NUDIX domain-containing protein [Cohnella sp. REN36]